MPIMILERLGWMEAIGVGALSILLSFAKPYWRRSLGAILLLFGLVIFDLAIPRLIQRIIDSGVAKQDNGLVLRTSLLMFGISILSALFALGNNYLSVQAGEEFGRDLRDALYGKIHSFSFCDLDRLKTGELMVRLTSDLNAAKTLVQISLRIGTRAPLLMAGSLVLMVRTSPRLALSVLPLLIFIAVVLLFFVFRMDPLFRAVQKKLDGLSTILQENIAGVRLIRAFVREDLQEERFQRANLDYSRGSASVLRFMSVMAPLLTLLVNLGVVEVIRRGGLESIRGDLSLGQIVAFINYLHTTMTPLVMMVMLSNTWVSGIVSARRIGEIMETIPEVRDEPEAKEFQERIHGRISFENVSFGYGYGTAETVLKDISFTAEAGETVAILGATGAGKTTLANLLPAFYRPTSGRILIDGRDIREMRQDSVRAHMGIVPQETVLFSGTIRENIVYGRPDAGDSMVVRAAEIARAHEFITKLSLGYDSPVDPGGANLSGGQKQRIAIARAVILEPEILILDDCTSSVDTETEIAIHEGLHNGLPRHTTILVAQRVSTVLKADRILVLERGRIAAMGTHQELLAGNSLYLEIFRSQLGDEDLEEDAKP